MTRTNAGGPDHRGNSPAAAVDGEVLPILVDPGTEASRAELEGHHSPLLDGVNRVLTID
jgi:hypothetical protein